VLVPEYEVVGLLVRHRNSSIEILLALIIAAKLEILLRWFTKPVSALAEDGRIGFILGEEDRERLLVLLLTRLAILTAVTVDV